MLRWLPILLAYTSTTKGKVMTHDELLVKLEQRYWKMFNHNSTDQSDLGTEHRILIQQSYFALRTVVELHKPDSNGICEACDGECWGCGEWGCEWPKCDCDCHPLYPCDTMQAIEKELG